MGSRRLYHSDDGGLPYREPPVGYRHRNDLQPNTRPHRADHRIPGYLIQRPRHTRTGQQREGSGRRLARCPLRLPLGPNSGIYRDHPQSVIRQQGGPSGQVLPDGAVSYDLSAGAKKTANIHSQPGPEKPRISRGTRRRLSARVGQPGTIPGATRADRHRHGKVWPKHFRRDHSSLHILLHGGRPGGPGPR